MKKLVLILVNVALAIVILGWSTREKYRDGVGIAYSIKNHGLELPELLGLAAGLAVLICGLVLKRKGK
jgi:hypothetical protein